MTEKPTAEPTAKRTKLNKTQMRKAQRYIDAGLSSPIVGVAIGARTRQVQRLRDDTGPRGKPKQLAKLFRTKAGQIECSSFLSVYRVIISNTGATTRADDIDIEAIIKAHHFLRHAMPHRFFDVLDINSAYGLVECYIAGDIRIEKCHNRHCRSLFLVRNFYGVVADCPICSMFTPKEHDEPTETALGSTMDADMLGDDTEDALNRLSEAYEHDPWD